MLSSSHAPLRWPHSPLGRNSLQVGNRGTTSYLMAWCTDYRVGNLWHSGFLRLYLVISLVKDFIFFNFHSNNPKIGSSWKIANCRGILESIIFFIRWYLANSIRMIYILTLRDTYIHVSAVHISVFIFSTRLRPALFESSVAVRVNVHPYGACLLGRASFTDFLINCV